MGEEESLLGVQEGEAYLRQIRYDQMLCRLFEVLRLAVRDDVILSLKVILARSGAYDLLFAKIVSALRWSDVGSQPHADFGNIGILLIDHLVDDRVGVILEIVIDSIVEAIVGAEEALKTLGLLW